MNKRDTLIWLNTLQGCSNKAMDNIEKHYHNIEDIWLSSASDIKAIENITDKLKQTIIAHKDKSYFDSIMEKIEKNGVNVVTVVDFEFPNKLKNIPDCPKVLYTKGMNLKSEEDIIAIVGSRRATSYGKHITQKFTNELLDLGLTVISGMAMGIDTEVHTTSIKKQKRNIAVLGCGVDIVYPKSNRTVYEKILEIGCIVSEFPLGTEPLPYNFPKRNRIISGMSSGVLVVEANEKSGSLITATHAAEQGKDVFAVPGNINSIYSRGTNLLIRDGAKLVLDVSDIIEEIREFKDLETMSKTKVDYSKLSKDEIKIVSFIEKEPMHTDLICLKTNFNISNVQSILTILEMKGIVKKLPNQLFAIV